jgi:uncharacterized protein YjbI with pentapeptide repeats
MVADLPTRKYLRKTFHYFIRGKMRKYMVFNLLVAVNFLLFAGFQAEVYADRDKDRIQENLHTLQNSKTCRGCDLSGADLNRMDLSGADLQGADLTEAKLYLVNFSGANLQNARLRRASLGGADLGGADLRGADLEGAELSGAYLEGAKFDGEFVKAKPYEEEGVPEVEKKQKDVAAVPKESKIKQKDEADYKMADVQKTARTQNPEQSVVSPGKKDESVKKILVSGNLEPSSDVSGESGGVKKDDAHQTQDVKLHEKADDIAERIQNDRVSKDRIQEPIKNSVAASATSSSGTSSPSVSAAGEDQKPASSSLVSGNTQSVIDDKKGLEESSSTKKSVQNQAPVEKNLLTEKQADKEKSAEAAPVQIQELSGEKGNNVKRLLQTKKCYRCDLAGVDLSDKNLNEADLEGANLAGCNLEKTDLGKAILKGASLVGANLKKANLKGADLYKANLSDADLTDANFENAKVDGTLFVGAIGR